MIMKQFYSDKIYFEATKSEIMSIRVAVSCWVKKHEDWLSSPFEADREYYKAMQQLYLDATHILEALPF